MTPSRCLRGPMPRIWSRRSTTSPRRAGIPESRAAVARSVAPYDPLEFGRRARCSSSRCACVPLPPHSPRSRGIAMFDRSIALSQVDPELWNAIRLENRRQEAHIEMIASENYASPAVMAAQGSQLTNKYAEGYPGKRYYGGCEHVDVAEQLAID